MHVVPVWRGLIFGQPWRGLPSRCHRTDSGTRMLVTAFLRKSNQYSRNEDTTINRNLLYVSLCNFYPLNGTLYFVPRVEKVQICACCFWLVIIIHSEVHRDHTYMMRPGIGRNTSSDWLTSRVHSLSSCGSLMYYNVHLSSPVNQVSCLALNLYTRIQTQPTELP